MIESIEIDNQMNPGNTYKIGGLTRFNFLVGKNSHGKSLAFWQIRMLVSNLEDNSKASGGLLRNLCCTRQDRIASIFLDIYARKKGYLFIENIEQDVHYTCYSELLQTLIITAQIENFQIFATTDSKEMLHSVSDLETHFGEECSVHRINLEMKKSIDYKYKEILYCAEENNYDREMRGL